MKKGLRITFNAPLVLCFALLCTAATLLGELTGESSTANLFCTYRAPLSDPMTYLRLFTHVIGHAGFIHLLNNMAYILLLGPMLEEKYGSAQLALVMLITAAVTGVIHMLFFAPNVHLLGASGIVFALILLSSITSVQERTIPVTFLLVAVLYIGQQIYQGVTAGGSVSYLTHILGGAVGSALGFLMNRRGQTYRKR